MGVKVREKVKGSWVMGVYKYTGKSGTVYFRVLKACHPHLRPIVLYPSKRGCERLRSSDFGGVRFGTVRYTWEATGRRTGSPAKFRYRTDWRMN